MLLLIDGLIALFLVMVAVLIDLVGAADMEDQTARLILAVAVIVVPPVGLTVYAFTRARLARALGATTLAGSGLFVVWMVASGWH